MLKRNLLTILLMAMFAGQAAANIVPHPELNIPYLCTFGSASPKDWGDDDYTNIIFFQIPAGATQDSIYLRVFDPDAGGNVDELNNGWNTQTEFSVYGGAGAYTDKDAQGVDPTGNYRSGQQLFSRTFGENPAADNRWVTVGAFVPKQGELVSGNYFFKVIIQGKSGDDGNLYKLAFSIDPAKNVFPPDMATFAFEWSFRLPDARGEVIYACPFEVPKDVTSITMNLWDFDSDNNMFLQTPQRTLPAVTGGNSEWTDTQYLIDKNQVSITSSAEHWEEVKYDLTAQERNGLWCFTILKGNFNHNDLVFYVKSGDGQVLKLRSSELPDYLKKQVVDDRTGDCNTIFVDASRSSDANKDALTFEWDFGDGNKADGVKATHRYEKSGVYTVSLTAYDNSGVPCDVGFKAIEVIINEPPVANAGADQVTSVGHTVHFDGAKSYDDDGKIVEYIWDFGDGTTGRGYATTHAYKNPGPYKVTLTVIDDSKSRCDRSKDEVTVIVNNPPKAHLGPDLVICDYTVSFDAAGSVDDDGLIDTYVWDFGDGTKGNGPQVSHTYRVSGKYKVSLTVRDNSGMTDAYDTAAMNVVINGQPVANAGVNKVRNLCIDEKLIFDGAQSYDPEGFALEYEWDFGDGSAKDKRVRAEHSYAKPGEFFAVLTVKDNSQTTCNVDQDTVLVKVFISPDAEAETAGPRKVCIGEKVKFIGKSSSWYIPITYYWSFGDNSPSVQGEQVEHAYEKPGVYDVDLTVVDNSGSTCNRAGAKLTVEVNYPPTAQAGVERRAAAGDIVIFKDAGSRDSDGKLTAHKWTFGDGSTADGPETKHTFDKPGKYPVVLTVQDDSGLNCATDNDTVWARINFPPLADAGPDEVICVGKVHFSGQKSSDADGQIIEYLWDFGDGATGRGQNPYHLYAKSGSYEVQLMVRDNSGTRTDRNADVKMIRINTPPKAVAGPGGIIRPGETFEFDASASADADGDPITAYEWDFGDGQKGSGVKVSHVYDKPGSYLVALTVKDNSNTTCNTGLDNTNVVVNFPPVAKADTHGGTGGRDLSGISARIFCTADQIVFDGTSSHDPDGKELTYAWDFGDGKTGIGVKTTHKYDKPGDYAVKLKVTDDAKNAELSHETTIQVHVNQPPVADAGPDMTVCGTTVTFDATKSVDPDGSVVTYTWDFGDKSKPESGATPTHTFPRSGTYTVSLTIGDNSGSCNASDSDALIVTINTPPMANAGGSKKACPGDELTFNGGKSFDSDGKISEFMWDFGDGQTGQGVEVKHKYDKPGKYNVVLTVKDNSGSSCGSHSDAVTVFINAAPVADAGPDQKVCIKSANCEVFFDGSASKDAENGKLTFEWDFGDGGKGRGIRPAHTYQRPGKFTVKLTVTDDSGTKCAVATDTMTIEANEQPLPVIDVKKP